MGALKGKNHHEKWLKGNKLTRKQAMSANCYICNGENEGGVDCKGGKVCPLYQYYEYRSK